jgi:hypothetical protein
VYTVTIGEQKYTTSANASAMLTILEYRIAGTTSTPSQPELPDIDNPYGIFLPLIISFGALVIIGILILVTLRK